MDSAAAAARAPGCRCARRTRRARARRRRRRPTRSSSSAPTRSPTTATPTSSPRAARCAWTREGNYLAADQVVWDRKTGQVRAEGNVVVLTPQGDKLVGENVVLTDTLRDGTIDNLLVVLESGGRIAAGRGIRSGNVTTLDNAIYSPCPVTSPTRLPASGRAGRSPPPG